MNKYKIEGNINFYEELKKAELLEDEVTDDNICLITGEQLTKFSVELKCKHKFNYLPLYKDLINFKKKYRHLEKTHVSNNEIRCPYCRERQELLPFHAELGLEKVIGVNAYLPTPLPIEKKYCEYISVNPYFDSNSEIIYDVYDYLKPMPEYTTIPCCKNTKCNAIGHDVILDNVTKIYCNYHHKKVLTEYNKQKALQLKTEQKLQKEKEKQLLKQKKEQEKLAKASLNCCENVVIVLNKCNKILKMGKNKGKQCECKIFENNLCKRHSNLEK